MRRLLAAALLVLACRPAPAMTLDEFRALADNRVAVRTSFGVRGAHAVDDRHVVVTLGMSVSEAAKSPEAYRIVGFQDPAYAFRKFVRPARAEARTEPEVEAPAGCPFPRFERTVVTLELPAPLRQGMAYYVVAQGVGDTMVTGAHTAQGFTYRPGVPPAPEDPAVDLAALGLRRVEPVGPSLLMLEFGPNFAPEPGSDPGHYRVRLDGRTVAVGRLGRVTRIDTYLPVGWPLAAIPMHQLFLELAEPFRDGGRIEVSVDETVTRAASTASFTFSETASLTGSIKANQLGYLPDSPKVAYLGRWMGSFPEKGAPSDGGPALFFPAEPEFHLCDARSGRSVFIGKARLAHRSGACDEGVRPVDHSGENVYLLDFTRFRRPGRYFLSVPQVGRSLAFDISAAVYEKAFRTQAYGVFAQRCGIELEPPYSEWRRVACHHMGILPTTQSRLEAHDLRDLARRVDYDRAVEVKPDPALAKLDADPSLLARWALDGDFRDVSGKGHDLVPVGEGQPFSPDNRLFPGKYQVFGPTPASGPVGATAGIPVAAAQGLTTAGWLRYEGGDNFDGIPFGFRAGASGPGKLHVFSVWGVLRASAGRGSKEIDGGRVGDGKWHHLALVLLPAAGEPSFVFYRDGTPVGTAPVPASVDADTFCLGTLTGKETGGKYFADYRVYRRALAPEEVRTLSIRRRETAQVLHAYGGHHDAGDYNPRSHIDVAQTLMDAYEMGPRKFADGQVNIPERGNGIPDILDEADWALRLWIGLQDADGGVFHGTESNGDPNFIQTAELDPLGDYAYAKDAAGSFTFAGAMAQAVRIRKSLGRVKDASGSLARARSAYDWASAHLQGSPAQPTADARAYAAAELLLTTGEGRFRDGFAASCVWAKKPDAGLEVYREYDQSRAAWAYARCSPAVSDPALRKAARDAIVRTVDRFISYNEKMAYAFLRHPWSPITWGTGAQLHWAIPAAWAWHLTGDPRYRAWLIRSCDNTLGANPLGLSYIVGIGTRAVRAPLHNSRYNHLGEVAPGMQVNGPMDRGEGYRVREVAYPPLRPDFACLHTFVDCHFSIAMDEGLVRSQAEAMACFGILLPDH